MLIQVRYESGAIENYNVEDVGMIIAFLDKPGVLKVSFDLFLGRMALYADGQYQIFGGASNYPKI